MSSSSAQEQDSSSTLIVQGNGPIPSLPAEENPLASTADSTSKTTLVQTESAVVKAPQFDDTTMSSVVLISPPSSQPPLTILFTLPTDSLATALLGSPTSTTVATSSSAVPFDLSHVPLSSTVNLLPTTTPLATSIITLAAATSTLPASTSAEMALASETPTATTVTQAAVDVPSASSSSAANNDSVVTERGNHAPFYIAVIVGSILAIGLIAAVIAWAVRLRLHARRRRENPLVPWANHHEAQYSLERSRDAIFIGQPIDRSASKDISSQDAVPWEPRGDRDVGEPKRSSSYLRSSLRSSIVPGPAPYAEHLSYPVHAHNAVYPAPYYHRHAAGDTNMSSDGTLDGYSSASSFGPLHVANLTPGDTSPASSPTSPVDMYTAYTGRVNDSGVRPREPYNEDIPQSNTQSRHAEETWDSLPLPGRTQNRSDETLSDDSRSWTASIRSNFTDAFNAVAASLPSGAALMINRQDKNLNGFSLRPTQSPGRQSVFSSLPRRNSSVSQYWTLEERDDGTGRVVFHDIESDGYSHGSELQPDATRRRHTLTGDAISSRVAQPPQFAMLTPNAYDTGLRQGRSVRQPSMQSTFSTASSSSAYSMASAISSVPRLPALSRHSTIKMEPPMTTVLEMEEIQSHFPKRPASLAMRSSSSGYSVYSYYGLSATQIEGVHPESTEGDEPKQQALVDRRSRRVI